MKILLYIFITTTYLYSYTKYTDENNVYFESDNFRVIAGISYSNDTDMENKAYLYLDSAEITWQKQIVELGFLQPKNSNIKKIDIYIGNRSAVGKEGVDTSIVSNFAGYATSYPSDDTPYFVMNPIMTDNQTKVTISHEFFHTIQYAYFNPIVISDEKWYANIWWLEATAVLMEDEVYDDIDDYINYLSPFFENSYKNIEIYDGWHEYSMVIFAKYIKEKYGLDIIKDTLTRYETSGTDGFYEILDVLLSENHNSSMKESLTEFAKWVSNTPKYFEEGIGYPALKHFNISDNITIGKGGVVVFDNLKSGWNMSTLLDTNISNLDIGSLNYIWSYEDGVWKNNISNDNYTDINSTNISKGYWVNVSSNSSSYYTYYDNTGILDISTLSKGWNLVGTTVTLTQNELQDSVVVWQNTGWVWKGYSPHTSLSELMLLNGYETLESIEPYSSYWIYK